MLCIVLVRFGTKKYRCITAEWEFFMKLYDWVFCFTTLLLLSGCWSKLDTFSELAFSKPIAHSNILLHHSLEQKFLNPKLGNRIAAITFFPWHLMQQSNTLELGESADYQNSSHNSSLSENEEEIAEELLQNSEELKRALAVELLSAQSQEISPEFWQSLSKQPPYVKIVILNRFGTEPNYFKQLLVLLKDSNEIVRLSALQNLTRIHSLTILPYLYPLLSDESAIIRSQTVKRLGEMGFWESISYLWPLLDDPEPSVRRISRLALEQLTGYPADYRDFDPPEQRQNAIQHWRLWWEHIRTSNP